MGQISRQNDKNNAPENEGLNRREALSAIAGAVFGVSAFARETLAGEVKVAEAGATKVVSTGVVKSDIEKSNLTEFEKYGFGTYQSLIEETLKTSDKEIINFISREGDKFLLQLPASERKDQAEELYMNLGDLFTRARGEKMPTQGSLEFVEKNVPQILIEFAAYPDRFPNLASKGKLLIATQEHKKSQTELRESRVDLERTKAELEKARAELERAKKLNKALGGRG